MKKCWQYRRNIIFCLLLLLIAGCAHVGMAPVPARDTLLSKEKPPIDFGAYGYLIFTKRPNVSDQKRYSAVCQAFIDNLEPVSAYVPPSNLMPTYWLVTNRFNKSSDDCGALVEKYDYSRSKILASAISRLNSKGPLLVAWSQRYEDVPLGEKALVLDLSDFSNEDLDRAFGIWMDRITRDPAVWHAGFDIVVIKEAFRSFLEKYGEHILNAVVKAEEILSGNLIQPDCKKTPQITGMIDHRFQLRTNK